MKIDADKPPQIDHAEKTQVCQKCQGTAVLLTPLKVVDKRVAVYGCQACGFSFTGEGRAFIETTSQLRDVFRGATLTNATLTASMQTAKLSPAAKALLQAQLLEYGVQMWYDGLKQGLLLGALQTERRQSDGNTA